MSNKEYLLYNFKSLPSLKNFSHGRLIVAAKSIDELKDVVIDMHTNQHKYFSYSITESTLEEVEEVLGKYEVSDNDLIEKYDIEIRKFPTGVVVIGGD